MNKHFTLAFGIMTLGLTGLAAPALAQSAAAPATTPGGTTTAPDAGNAPSPQAAPDATAPAPEAAADATAPSQALPACSATVHDECTTKSGKVRHRKM